MIQRTFRHNGLPFVVTACANRPGAAIAVAAAPGCQYSMIGLVTVMAGACGSKIADGTQPPARFQVVAIAASSTIDPPDATTTVPPPRSPRGNQRVSPACIEPELSKPDGPHREITTAAGSRALTGDPHRAATETDGGTPEHVSACPSTISKQSGRRSVASTCGKRMKACGRCSQARSSAPGASSSGCAGMRPPLARRHRADADDRRTLGSPRVESRYWWRFGGWVRR